MRCQEKFQPLHIYVAEQTWEWVGIGACYSRSMIPSEHRASSVPASSADVPESLALRNSALVVSGIMALGAVLRLIALGHKSFWLDEIASVVMVRMPGNSFWSWVWHSEGNMALYYVMLRPWLQFGLSEASVRML